jgi:hypothetical protein
LLCLFLFKNLIHKSGTNVLLFSLVGLLLSGDGAATQMTPTALTASPPGVDLVNVTHPPRVRVPLTPRSISDLKKTQNIKKDSTPDRTKRRLLPKQKQSYIQAA